MTFTLQEIDEKIRSTLNPDHLLLHDGSGAHAGHAGVMNSTAPVTHLTVEIKAGDLIGLPRVQAHQKVYRLLTPYFDKGLHAVEIKILR